MTRRTSRQRGSERLYVYSEEDVAKILSDCFIDMREVVDDYEAARCLDIVQGRLTDDYYSNE